MKNHLWQTVFLNVPEPKRFSPRSSLVKLCLGDDRSILSPARTVVLHTLRCASEGIWAVDRITRSPMWYCFYLGKFIPGSTTRWCARWWLESGIIEVKCPYKHCLNATPDACKRVDGEVNFGRPTTSYYFQVTGQLAITEAVFCDFRHETFTALWNPYRRVSLRGRRAQIRFSRGARGEKPENDRPPFWFYGESIWTFVHGSRIVIVEAPS